MDSYSLLIALAAVAFVITIINPFYIIPLFVVGSLVEPIQYFPGLVEYNPTTIMGIIVIVGWALHIFFFGGFESVKSKQVMMFWLFLLWMAISSYIHMESSWGIFAMYIRAFIPYLIFLYIIKTRQQLSIVIWLLVIISAIAAIYGIYCLKANIGVSDRGLKRITSFFSNPNAFGNTLSLIVPITISLLFHNKYSKSIKAFILWLLALIVTGVVISYSRKCFFALSAALLLTPYKLSKPGNKVTAVIITIFLTLSATYVFPDRVKWRLWSRVENAVTAESLEELDLGRSETNKAGYKMMLENPWVGVGFGGFKTEYFNITEENTDIQLVRRKGEIGLGAHNLYVQVGASVGLIGLLFYLLMIYFAFRDAMIAEKNFKERKDDYFRNLSASYQVYIVVFLFIGIYSGVLTTKVFWMITPLSAILKKLSIQQELPITKSDIQEI